MDPCEDEPWINFNKSSDVLAGNRSGFELLGKSIDRLIAGETGPIVIDGEEIEIVEVRLTNRPTDIPKPPLGSPARFITFLVLLTLFLILAGIGVVASVDWLTSPH